MRCVSLMRSSTGRGKHCDFFFFHPRTKTKKMLYSGSTFFFSPFASIYSDIFSPNDVRARILLQ
jgi:hypothetical protein